MLLAIIFLIFFLFIEFILNFKKHLTYAFTLYFTGIALVFLGTVFYIVKVSYIQLYTDIDKYIYNIIVNFHIGIAGISRIILYGTALFMFGSVYLLNIIGKKQSFITNILFILPILGIAVWYDPALSYRVFIAISSKSAFINESFIDFINDLCLLVFVVYMFLPPIKLYRKYHLSQIHSVLVNAILLEVCIFMIDIYVLWCFIFGFMSPFMPWNMDLNRFITIPVPDSYVGVFVPLTILFVISVLYITIWYKPLGSIKFIQALTRRRIFKEFDQNLRIVFHSNKNLFLAINRLSNQFNEYVKTDIDTAVSIVKDIEELSEKGLNTLTQSLNMVSDISKKNHKADLKVCIENALSKAYIPSYIKVKKTDTDDLSPAMVNASQTHITECIINIINNSVEAINEAERESGLIKIRLIKEDDYACIEITDNGCGISKKDKRNMFSMLYSTKKSSTNWGIGLSYTNKVILAYNGLIYVKSKLGEHTMFQITLPLANND